MMKKRFISFAVAMALAAAGAQSVFADVEPVDKLSGDISVGTFFTKKSDAIELKSGERYNIKFHNKSLGTLNHENFVICFATAAGEAYTGGAQEALVLRADNWGWNGGAADFGDIAAGWANSIDWENFAANTQKGFDVSLDIIRDGNSIRYVATYSGLGANGTDAIDMWKGTSTVDLPESLYIFLSGENVEITDLSSEKLEAPEEGLIEQVFWWTEWTPTYTIKDGETLNISLEQLAANGNIFCSLNAIFVGADINPAVDGYDPALERVILRSDNYGWGPGWANEKVTYTATDYLYHGNDFDYKTYLTGAKYDVEITRDGTTLDYVINFTSGTGEKAVYSYKIADIDDENSYVFFTFDAGAKWKYQVKEDTDETVKRVAGDANGDGEVSVSDVLLMQQFLAKWNVKIDESAADVTGDGEVTVADVLLIQQYLAKWNVTLK